MTIIFNFLFLNKEAQRPLEIVILEGHTDIARILLSRNDIDVTNEII